MLSKLPGFVLNDVFVDAAHERPDVLEGARELITGEKLVRTFDYLRGQFGNGVVTGGARRLRRGIGNLFAEVACDHRESPAREVAEVIGQVRVVSLHQSIEREASVLPEDDFAQQEIAQRVGAEHLKYGLGAHDVAARF